MSVAEPPEVIPTGFVRLVDGAWPLCDAAMEQVEIMIRDGGLLWNGCFYELTPEGRAYVKGRLLN
jgi:hypothetical protein